MENIRKTEILESIGKVYEEARDCKLEHSFFESVRPEMTILSQYFNTSDHQTLFIAVVFAQNYRGDLVDLNDLITYFNCNPMKMLEYHDDLELLYKQGIFQKQKSRQRVQLAGTAFHFIIHEKITEAILQSKALPETNGSKKMNEVVDFLEQLYDLGEQRDVEKISSADLFLAVDRLLQDNSHFPLIEKIKQFGFSTKDSYLFLYLVWKTLSGRQSTDVGRALEGIHDSPSVRINEMQKILSGSHALIESDLVEVVEAQFFNDIEAKLTNVSFQLLNDCGINLFVNKRKRIMLLPLQKLLIVI